MEKATEEWTIVRRVDDSGKLYYIRSIWSAAAQWTPDVDEALKWPSQSSAEQFWAITVATSFPNSFVMQIAEMDWFVEKRLGPNSYFLQDVTHLPNTVGNRIWTPSTNNAKGFPSHAETHHFIKTHLPNDSDLIIHNKTQQ